VTPGPLETQSSDGVNHFSQPLPSIINIPAGGKALLRIVGQSRWQHPFHERATTSASLRAMGT
jgi:hypothetical protein